MTKSKVLKKYETELADQLEFSDFGFPEDSPSDNALAGVMGGLMEASNHQMTIALELTN